MNSDYKKYFIRQEGLNEISLKPSKLKPSDADPKELEAGIEDEKEHTDSTEGAQTITLQHLEKHPKYYSQKTAAGLDEFELNTDFDSDDVVNEPSPRDKMMSPTAIAPQVIGVAIRGSSTGGLPSGADQTGISPSTPTGKLGGYEPIKIDKGNSVLVDKTPQEQKITTSEPIAPESSDEHCGEEHPHQVQKDEEHETEELETPEDEMSMSLKSAAPQIELNEGKYSCKKCGRITDDGGDCYKCKEEAKEELEKSKDSYWNNKFPDDELNEGDQGYQPKTGQKCSCKPGSQRDNCRHCEGTGEIVNFKKIRDKKLSTDKLNETLSKLAPKALEGKLTDKESKLFSMIKEVLSKRKTIEESKKKFPWEGKFEGKPKEKKSKTCSGGSKCKCGCNWGKE